MKKQTRAMLSIFGLLIILLITPFLYNFSSYIGMDTLNLASWLNKPSITILNPQEYPALGGEWQVNFKTQGEADLIITATQGEFGKDLEFLKITCGDKVLDHEWQDSSILIKNYQCKKQGRITSRVLKEGRHTLRFKFGKQIAYAHNLASKLRMEWGNITLTDTDWKTVNLTLNFNTPIVVVSPEYTDLGTGHYGTEAWTSNITSNSFRVHVANEFFNWTGVTYVHYIVIEKGNWTLPNGIRIEAGNFSTDKYGYKGAWGCAAGYGEQITFVAPFNDAYPLVLISRASNHNATWWGGAYNHKYDTYSSEVATSDGSMCAGLDQNRMAQAHTPPGMEEEIDYIIVDSGDGTLNNIEYEILMSGTTVWMQGYTNGIPDTYPWVHSWTDPPRVIVGGKTAIHGSDGSWVVIYDTGDTSNLRAFVDEGEERSHTGTESGGAWAFASNGTYTENLPPTTPTNITCDGSGNCNITIDKYVNLTGTGSTDTEEDAINYTIEASLQNITITDDQEQGEKQAKAEQTTTGNRFKVYHGSFQFTSALGTSTTQNIGATIDPDHAFLLVYSAGSSTPNLPSEGAVSGYISSSTQLTFERTTAVDGLYVSWFVIEALDNQFTVRGRGSITLAAGASSNTASVSGVQDANQVTVVYGLHKGSGTSTSDMQDVFTNVHLTDANTITAKRDSTATGTQAIIRYEVVEWSSDYNIYTGETTSSSNPTTALISGSGSASDPIINMSRSFMLASWTATQNGIQQVQMYYNISNTNEVTFGQYSAARSNVIRWYVIESPTSAPFFVQRFSYNWDPTTAPDNVKANTIPVAINASTSFIKMSCSTSGTGTAFRRDFNLPRLKNGTSWNETQYNPATASYDQHETRASVVELPYITSSGTVNDTEAAKSWESYYNVDDGTWKNLTGINVTVYVSVYDNSGSQQKGNTNPTLQLQLYTGSAWKSVGNFSISGTGNVSLNTTDYSILSGWQTASNRNLRIRGVYMDWYDSSNIDQVNWTAVWVKINGQKWTALGNHTNTSTLRWNTTDIPEQNCIDLRTRAIDNGSFTYSSYFTKGSCLNISHVAAAAPTVSFTTVDDDFEIPLGIIDLTALSTRNVFCNGTVTDADGGSDIIAVNATFYDASASSSDAADNNATHYTNRSCWLSAADGNNKYFECLFLVRYFANNATWQCNATAYDSSNLGSNTTNATINE
ncbi:hypothetical protein B6U80_02180, partial [Candidatus Pacearchaeota archaeon ex4484_26]